jgi:hypothetical protein
MAELESIARDIVALKQLIRVAWQTLGSGNLSDFNRLDARIQMQKAESDLRKALQDFQHEHDRLRKLHAERTEEQAPRKVKLKLLD